MRYETADSIFRVLKQYPLGTTSPVVAQRLGWTMTKTSFALGRLFFAGTIDRVPAPARRANGFRYQIKQKGAF